MTSCLKSIAWKKPARSIDLFSWYFSIFFKHIFADCYYPSWRIQHKRDYILPAAEMATSWISATRDMDILPKDVFFFLAFNETWLEHNDFASAPVHANSVASVLGHQTYKKGKFFYICKLVYLLHQFISHPTSVLLVLQIIDYSLVSNFLVILWPQKITFECFMQEYSLWTINVLKMSAPQEGII